LAAAQNDRLLRLGLETASRLVLRGSLFATMAQS
jgi:hypothetical protein